MGDPEQISRGTITDACDDALAILEAEPGPPEWTETPAERERLIEACAAIRRLYAEVRPREAPTDRERFERMKRDAGDGS